MPIVVPTDRTSSAVHRQMGQRLPFAQRHEGEIAGDEHQAGDPRPDGRRRELAVGLQQSVEDDREPVEEGLRGEGDQHVAGGGHDVGPGAVGVGVGRVEQRGDRAGSGRDDHDDRDQDDDGPRQQGRGDVADPGLLGRVSGRPLGRAGQHRDHGARERAAQHQLIQQVGDLVGGDIRPAQAGGSDGLREDQRADQTQQPGQYGKAGDDGGAAGDARAEPRRQARVLRAPPVPCLSCRWPAPANS